MSPWRNEVESKMASSSFDEKLAESVRKYTVLYDKRCRDVANWDQCLMIENINLQYKHIFSVVLKRYFFHPLSTLYTKATTRRLNEAKAFHSCRPSWKKFDCLTAPMYLAFLAFAFDVLTSFPFSFAFALA